MLARRKPKQVSGSRGQVAGAAPSTRTGITSTLRKKACANSNRTKSFEFSSRRLPSLSVISLQPGQITETMTELLATCRCNSPSQSDWPSRPFKSMKTRPLNGPRSSRVARCRASFKLSARWWLMDLARHTPYDQRCAYSEWKMHEPSNVSHLVDSIRSLACPVEPRHHLISPTLEQRLPQPERIGMPRVCDPGADLGGGGHVVASSPWRHVPGRPLEQRAGGRGRRILFEAASCYGASERRG